MKTMKWITVILGVALFLAPFVLGYSDNSRALWTSLIMGAVIAVLGYAVQFKVAAVIGVLTFVAPWIIGFDGNDNALWSCLVVGAATVLLTGYQGFFAQSNAETGSVQQRQAK